MLRSASKRSSLWLSLLICFAAVYALTLFVWQIEITGASDNKRGIMTALSECGLDIGSLKKSVNARQLINGFLLKMPEYRWMSYEFTGCKANVTVFPAEEESEFPDAYSPCDLISDKTGIVTATRIRSGVLEVKKGQTVMKGDRIVSGTVISTQGDVTLVASYGEIELRTWHSVSAVMPLTYFRENLSELRGKSVHFRFADRRFPLFPVETDNNSCYDKYIMSRSSTVLPLSLDYCEYFVSDPDPFRLDAVKCAEYMQAHLLKLFVIRNPDAEVVRTSFTYSEDGDAVFGKLLIECLETTGVPAPIR